MTSKEAVNLFKQDHWRVVDENKALEILEELVDRDTPKKVRKSANPTLNIAFCPKCRRILDIGYNGCPYCLQRLDWSE